jgi:hypothetical protein
MALVVLIIVLAFMNEIRRQRAKRRRREIEALNAIEAELIRNAARADSHREASNFRTAQIGLALTDTPLSTISVIERAYSTNGADQNQAIARALEELNGYLVLRDKTRNATERVRTISESADPQPASSPTGE